MFYIDIMHTWSNFGCRNSSRFLGHRRSISVTVSLCFGLWNFSTDRFSNTNTDTSWSLDMTKQTQILNKISKVKVLRVNIVLL